MCETVTIICLRNYSLFHCEKDEVLLDLRTRTGLAIEKLHSKFENVDVAVRENPTVRVVLLVPKGACSVYY